MIEEKFRNLKKGQFIKIENNIYFVFAFINDISCQQNNNPYYILLNKDKDKKPYLKYMDLNFFKENYKGIKFINKKK